MSLIKKYDFDFLLDQACLKALDDKGLLLKKPIRIGHLVVDKSSVPTPRTEGKSKITNRKKLNTFVQRSENEEV
tara:strand:- start:266 stop:487 length:222 start_codon:yes stop_codon:yes gene_type:complete